MKNILVIGGGLFGCTIASELSSIYNVTLIEKENDILTQASKCNHNRIHYGYHYPRSLETAKQSLDGLMLFQHYYSDAIVSNFKNYYAIAKYNSKVNANKYKIFCDYAGIPYTEKYPSPSILNRNLIENCFEVNEPIYDISILKQLIYKNLKNVNLLLNTRYDKNMFDKYDFIINCSYASINEIHDQIGVDKLNFKYQDVIIPIFSYDHERIGLTIMDGNYCSIMPKGFNNNLFLLYHVKHSVLQESPDPITLSKIDTDVIYETIRNDSKKYYPFLENVKFIDYWRTIRVLPINDNDERLSKIVNNLASKKVITVFSGKVSTCVIVAKQIKNLL
jgi:hypothetical protein